MTMEERSGDYSANRLGQLIGGHLGAQSIFGFNSYYFIILKVVYAEV